MCGYSTNRPPVAKYAKMIRAQKRMKYKPKNLEANIPFLKIKLNPNIPTSVDMTKLYRSSTIVSTEIQIKTSRSIKFKGSLLQV
jgi:hypothetical protein